MLIGLALLALLRPTLAQAQVAALPELIASAARHAGVHPDLLSSIVWVESRAWPWALNINGVSLYPRTRAEAERILGRVGDDVDIGYAQVSYRHWGRALGLRKADLLEPWTNLIVGALILRHSMDREAGWGGVGRYHSATSRRKLSYAHLVAATLSMIKASRRPAAFDMVGSRSPAGR
ncbi:MAG: transglycosylase SLT domain-containing protein [Candidatus Rokuibacteriota bacterium]